MGQGHLVGVNKKKIAMTFDIPSHFISWRFIPAASARLRLTSSMSGRAIRNMPKAKYLSFNMVSAESRPPLAFSPTSAKGQPSQLRTLQTPIAEYSNTLWLNTSMVWGIDGPTLWCLSTSLLYNWTPGLRLLLDELKDSSTWFKQIVYLAGFMSRHCSFHNNDSPFLLPWSKAFNCKTASGSAVLGFRWL